MLRSVPTDSQRMDFRPGHWRQSNHYKKNTHFPRTNGQDPRERPSRRGDGPSRNEKHNCSSHVWLKTWGRKQARYVPKPNCVILCCRTNWTKAPLGVDCTRV